MSRLWNADWPDRSTRETRAEFIERMRPYFPKGGDTMDVAMEQRTRAALASANAYHLERDPRTVAQRLKYAEIDREPRWTAGDPDGEE